MRTTTTAAVVFAVATFTRSTQASQCSLIREHDARMTCFAIATGNSSWCSFIKDPDQRVKCKILLRK